MISESKKNKQLKNFLKSFLLLPLICFFVIQNFTPLLAQTCKLSCPPPCAAFDPDRCECLPRGCTSTSSSSSSSSGNCTVMNCPPPCTAFDPDRCECLPRGCVSTSSSSSSGCGPIICPLGCLPNPITCMCVCSSSSSSSSSGGLNPPFCTSGQVRCNSGVPSCTSGNIPVCGSIFGFTGDLAGPGCTDQAMTFFNHNSAFCRPNLRIPSLNKIISCDKNLCDYSKGRFQPCREDQYFCKCVCPFVTRNQKQTPRCNQFDQATCSNNSIPLCTKTSNRAVCYDYKLFCQDIDVGFIDLVDKVFCK